MTGRPSEYTQEKADLICAYISEGKTIRTICTIDGMPSAPTFYKWLREEEIFLKQYEKAKADQSDAMIEEMLDIADDKEEEVQRSRLRIDTRKWLASKLKPKKYGDSTQVKHSNFDGTKDLSAAVSFIGNSTIPDTE